MSSTRTYKLQQKELKARDNLPSLKQHATGRDSRVNMFSKLGAITPIEKIRIKPTFEINVKQRIETSGLLGAIKKYKSNV